MAINYPAALLENTFTDKFFQEQVRPFQTGATNVKPSLSSTIKNWRPHKAFMPQSMGGTFYTKPTLGAARFLGGTGIGTLMGAYTGAADLLQKHLEEQGLTGEGGIYDQSGGWGAMGAGADIPIIRKMIMDKRATQKGIAQVAMRKRIQEEERQRAAAAAAQAAAAQQVRQNIQTYGNRDRPNTGMNRPGGGRGQSPTGGDVAGTPFYRGGLASLYG